jgi:hypothetical protein
MKEADLTGIPTPDGNMAFEEARLIIECKLMALSTVGPDDFCSQEAKDFINEAYREAHVYRNYMYGEITRVWVKKQRG